MRLPSVGRLYNAASQTLERYPTVLAAAFVAAAAGIGAVNLDNNVTLAKILVTAQLGIPFFFALAVHGAKRRLPRPWQMGLAAGAAAALVGYYTSLPGRVTPGAATRFVLYNAGLHLLVAWLPFAGSNELNGFWQYNKQLFVRFLTAVLYSAVLYLGLALALAAIDQLFGVDIDGETYASLWIFIAMLFNTWFFLGGVPTELEALERDHDYPRGLKVFTQFVLIPLVIIYLLILTVYLGKVLVTWVWPSGWIGWLVSSVAGVGILAMLLVYPIRDDADNKWVRTYARWFYIFLLPSIAMLWMAIWKRVDQYGITEKRYLLAVLAVWLAGVAIYFTLSRAKNVKVIPASLCIIAFATSIGPWGAFEVSERSPRGRLEAILVANRILVDDIIRTAPGKVSFDDRKEIGEILRYLIESHGRGSIVPLFGQTAAVDTIAPEPMRDRAVATSVTRALMKEMGLEYVEPWAGRSGGHFNYGTINRHYTLPIADYDYVIKSNYLLENGQPISVAGRTYEVDYDPDTMSIALTSGDTVVIDMRLEEWLERLRHARPDNPNVNEYAPELMRVAAENDSIRLLLDVGYISGTETADRFEIQTLQADLFVKFR